MRANLVRAVVIATNLAAALAGAVAPAVDCGGDAAGTGAVTCAPTGLTLSGFGIQYWGETYTVEDLTAAPHCMLIIEASVRGAEPEEGTDEQLFSPAELLQIRRDGARPVLAYLNVGELAPYRDYWAEAFEAGAEAPANMPPGKLPAWYGGRMADGSHLAAFWRPEWRSILHDRIDVLLAHGFDGVFLDDVLHYFTWATDPPPDLGRHAGDGTPQALDAFAQAMMELVIELADHARRTAAGARSDFAIIINGGVFIGWDAASSGEVARERHSLFQNYLAVIDGIAVESVLGPLPDRAAVRELEQGFADLPVLSIDYASRHHGHAVRELRAMVARQARAHDFHPYLAEDETLNRLAPPLFARAVEVTAQDPQSGCEQAASGAAPSALKPE